jgi:hypothetical protein
MNSNIGVLSGIMLVAMFAYLIRLFVVAFRGFGEVSSSPYAEDNLHGCMGVLGRVFNLKAIGILIALGVAALLLSEAGL